MKVLINLFLAFLLNYQVFANPPLISYWDSTSNPEIRISNHPNNGQPRNSRARLPQNVIPIHYELEIQPLLTHSQYGEIFTMPGKLTITVQAKDQPSNLITLHSLTDIKQESVAVTRDDGTPLQVAGHELDPENEFHILHLGEPLEVDAIYHIYMEYVAKLPHPDEFRGGIYLSFYPGEDGERKYLAVSQLQPTDARRAFPSFDEPALKATFQVSIIRQEHHISLWNMELINQEPLPSKPGWVRDVFGTTPRMSSYLNCFAVCDFIPEFSQTHYNVSVYGPEAIIRQGGGKYAAEFINDLLKGFDDYLGLNYTLPHLANIGIPFGFGGAMENWGFNAYDIGIMLWNEGESTLQTKVGMSSTMSHEVVHAWFGNLITADWWSILWLNEGFAAYFTQVGAALVNPELYTMEAMLNTMVQNALAFDPKVDRPLNSPVDTPDEINSIFDTITYQKGGSLLRMINAFMGEENFLNGLRDYLEKFQYQNTVQDNLFASLDEFKGETTNGIPIKQILDGWTLQDGFPLLRATRDLEAGTLSFTQEKYVADADSPFPDEVNWFIPIFYTQEDGNPTPNIHWFNADVETETMQVEQGDKWVLVNPSQFGFYRILYDSENLDLLSNQLRTDPEAIYLQSRAMLVDDVLNLALAKYMNWNIALDFLLYMPKERDLIPWTSLINNMAYTNRMFIRSSTYVHFRKFMLGLMSETMEEIGYESDLGVISKTLLRTRLSDWMCNMGDESCINFAKASMQKWMDNPPETSLIFPDLQPLVYCHSVANDATDEVFDFVFEQYKTFNRPLLPETMRLNLLRALACPKDPYKLSKFLAIILDPHSEIRPEHRNAAIQAVAANANGVDIVFSFIRNNFDDLVRRFGQGMISAAISTMSNYINTELEKRDVEAFINIKWDQLEQVQSSLRTSLNNIDANILWMTTHHEPIRSWLISH